MYGLALRIHVAASIDRSAQIAGHVAKQQMEVMASYLNFKKKFKSGFGMNTFWIMLNLDNDGNIRPENACMIELLTKLFTALVFDSTVFVIEQDDPKSSSSKKILKDVVKGVADRAGCRTEDIMAMTIKPLTSAIWYPDVCSYDGNKETAVASMFKIFDETAKQTYRDPNPFEPEGLSHPDALALIEAVRQKYKLKEQDWYLVLNHVYTMISN